MDTKVQWCTGVSGGDDKTFSESVFLQVSSEQAGWRDKVIGSRGQTVDLSPHGSAVICCAVKVQASHAGGNQRHAETMITSQRSRVLESSPARANANNMRASAGQYGAGLCFRVFPASVWCDFQERAASQLRRDVGRKKWVIRKTASSTKRLW